MINKDHMINKIAKSFPTILDCGLEEYERVQLLRRWAATAIRWASPEYLMDHNRLSFDEMLDHFENDRAGVMCGGAALFLKYLYNIFGYRAGTINYGDSDGGFTHVITLVETVVKGKTFIVVEDCCLNGVFVQSDGLPLGYLELLKKVKNGIGIRKYWSEDPIVVSAILDPNGTTPLNRVNAPTSRVKILQNQAHKYRFCLFGHWFAERYFTELMSLKRSKPGKSETDSLEEESYHSLMLRLLNVEVDWDKARFIQIISEFADSSQVE